jgi:hypothetical protein
MNVNKTNRFVYVKRYRRGRSQDRMQLSIMFGFLLISTLASLWLPIYFISLAVKLP